MESKAELSGNCRTGPGYPDEAGRAPGYAQLTKDERNIFLNASHVTSYGNTSSHNSKQRIWKKKPAKI